MQQVKNDALIVIDPGKCEVYSEIQCKLHFQGNGIIPILTACASRDACESGLSYWQSS